MRWDEKWCNIGTWVAYGGSNSVATLDESRDPIKPEAPVKQTLFGFWTHIHSPFPLFLITRQNHQIGSLSQINYQNGFVSFLFNKGVCYFTPKSLPEGRVPPERDTWRDLTGRWDKGGSGGLTGETTSGGLLGATSSGGAQARPLVVACQARPLVVGPGTSLSPIKPLSLLFIFT